MLNQINFSKRVMKKFLILAVAALVASVACTKVSIDETATPDVEIGFQVAAYLNQTRSGHSAGHTSLIAELEEVGADSNYFKSVAYLHAAKADGTIEDPALFFLAEEPDTIATINFDDASDSWKPSKPYYWPKSPKSSISFFSWYDFGDQVRPAVKNYTSDGAAIEFAWPDRTVALKDNVLYADAAYHYKKNDNGSQNHNLDGTSNGVPTLFHHALAKVRFTIAQNPMNRLDSGENYTFWEVKIDTVALVDGKIKSNGKFSLTETSKTAAATQGTWTMPADSIWAAPESQSYLNALLGNESGHIFDTDVAQGLDSLTNAAVSLTGENFMNDNYFTVMPQQIANDVTLLLVYTIKTYYGTETEYAKANHGECTLISTETINVNDFGPSVGNFGAPYTDNGIQLNAISGAWTKWTMNRRYVYNLIINPETDMILYDPAVAPWEDERSSTQYVPKEPTV